MQFQPARPEVGYLKVGMYGAPGSGKCILDGYVLTTSGMQKIDTIGAEMPYNESPWLQTLGLSQNSDVQVDTFYKEKVAKVLRITTRHGYNLTGTYAHPILVWTKSCEFQMKCLQDLCVGDIAIIARGTAKYGLKAYALTQYDAWEFSSGAYILPDTLNEEFSTLLGYFVADGSLSESTIVLSNTQTWFRESMVDVLASFGVEKADPCRLGNKALVRLFREIFQCSENITAHNKHVPDCILQSPKILQVAFLRSLIDCDGYLAPNGRQLEYYTSSRELANQVRLMLLNMGIITSTYCAKKAEAYDRVYTHDYWRLRINGLELKKYAQVIGSLKYDMSCLTFDTKRNSDFDSIPYLKQRLRADVKHWREIVGWKANGMMCALPGRFPRYNTLNRDCGVTFEALEVILSKYSTLGDYADLSLYRELSTLGYHFDPITQVEVLAKEVDVYDVHVPKEHRFWANGFVSHNTFTSLLCATRLGKTLMIDTEQGSTLYAPNPDLPREKDFPSFDILHTRDIHEVTEAIVEACKQGYDAVIIDQATHLWEFCADDFLDKERTKASKLYYDWERTGNFPFMAWKKIKKPWKKFVRTLLDTPIHVFITGRLVVEYEIGSGAGSTSITKAGDRMGGEKDLEYEVHVTLRLERLSSKIKAYVKKDRSGTLSGIIINPKGDIFDGILKRLGKEHKEIPKDVELESSDSTPMHPEALLLMKLAMKGGASQEEVDAVLASSSLIEIKNLNKSLLIGKCTAFKSKKEEKKNGKDKC